MGVVQTKLPDTLQQTMDRQIANGLVANPDAYLQEAIRRYAEDLEAETDLIIEAQAGIEDIEAGRFVTINTEADAEAWFAQRMALLQERLSNDQG